MKADKASSKTWALYFVAPVLALHLVSAGWHLLYGGQNIDEGFYALAARSVWQGELPYRDFGYTQMPLLPYVNGLAMQLTGFGLFEQRAVNAVWAVLTLVLMGLWLGRRTSPGWAAGLVALFSLSAPWMYYIHLGKTYAFTGLVVMMAVWVFTEWKTGAARCCLLAGLGTIGVGCRLPAAGFFAVLWLATFVDLARRGNHDWLWAGLGSLICPVVLLSPFYFAAPEATRFWVFGYHQSEIAHKTWHLAWSDILVLAPVPWLSLCAVLVLSVRRNYRPDAVEIVLGGATLLTLALNLLPHGVYEEYAVPFLPPLLMFTAAPLWRAGSSLPWLRHAMMPAGLIVVNLAASVALLWPTMPATRHGGLSMFLPLGAPDYDPALPASIAQGRLVVQQFLPPNRPFIGPCLILAVEAGRSVPSRLRMGPFTATADFPPDQAQRLNLATLPELDAYLADPSVPLVALTKTSYLNYAWSIPSHRSLNAPGKSPWFELFQRDFVVAYEDRDFFVLVRKPATASRSSGNQAGSDSKTERP